MTLDFWEIFIIIIKDILCSNKKKVIMFSKGKGNSGEKYNQG